MGAALDMPVKNTIQIRRDTAANWASINPILASGEQGYETDTQSLKIGDGTTRWNSLGYQFNPVNPDFNLFNNLNVRFDGTGFLSNERNYTLNSQEYRSFGYAFTPDSNALDITGDLELIAKIQPKKWSYGGVILTKASSATNFAYSLGINSANSRIRFQWYDGVNVGTLTESNILSFDDDTVIWIKVTFDADNGANGATTSFFTSTDGSNWTGVGSGVWPTPRTIMNSNGSLTMGGNYNTGSTQWFGKIQRVIVKNGINGTVVFDANFETVLADSFVFTESSTNAASVFLTSNPYTFGLPNAFCSNITTTALTANTTYFNQFSVQNKPINVRHLAFDCTTAPASNATVRIAIYKADANMQPTGAPVYNTGAITVLSSAAAAYRIRIPVTTLLPGNYVLAMNTSVGFTTRAYLGNREFVYYLLGTNSMGVSHSVSQTLTEDFPPTPVLWDTRTFSSTAARNFVVIGWY